MLHAYTYTYVYMNMYIYDSSINSLYVVACKDLAHMCGKAL